MIRLAVALLIPALAQPQPLTGPAALGDWRADAPGIARHITPNALPAPYATRSASNTPSVVQAPQGALPHVPPGFTVQRYAENLRNPRLLRTAPNGDVVLAETAAGRIRILRAPQGAPRPTQNEVYASGLDLPFGIAFYPPGPNPQYLYVATVDSIIRYPYRNGDLHPSGPPETILPRLTQSYGNHTTRDLQFTPDGTRLLVSIGSASNVAQSMPRRTPDQIRAWETTHGRGAPWSDETNRAQILALDPNGQTLTPYATGLRNCVGMATHPLTHDLWCATNERDGLGDDLPPDYVTRVREHAFYGWPWFYLGSHEDPRHPGERPDLAPHVTPPDILIQAHSAPLQMTFYPLNPQGPAAFPPQYRGDAFAALHGSWNRAKRTGYKLIRIHLVDGVPDGTYEDFLTGFVLSDDRVWGRPVGVTVANDGALLVSEDGNGTIWRITPTR